MILENRLKDVKSAVGYNYRSRPHFFDNIVIGMVVGIVFCRISFHKGNVVRIGDDLR